MVDDVLAPPPGDATSADDTLAELDRFHSSPSKTSDKSLG
jgi:hypothetical protein